MLSEMTLYIRAKSKDAGVQLYALFICLHTITCLFLVFTVFARNICVVYVYHIAVHRCQICSRWLIWDSAAETDTDTGTGTAAYACTEIRVQPVGIGTDTEIRTEHDPCGCVFFMLALQ